MNDLHQFSISSNGDQWFLGRRESDGAAYVLHRANTSSGGHETETPVTDFLNTRPYGPERGALIQLLGVADDKAEEQQDSYSSSSL